MIDKDSTAEINLGWATIHLAKDKSITVCCGLYYGPIKVEQSRERLRIKLTPTKTK